MVGARLAVPITASSRRTSRVTRTLRPAGMCLTWLIHRGLVGRTTEKPALISRPL
jgi:hypothetical protein